LTGCFAVTLASLTLTFPTLTFLTQAVSVFKNVNMQIHIPMK
jgi:hypothetical protein